MKHRLFALMIAGLIGASAYAGACANQGFYVGALGGVNFIDLEAGVFDYDMDTGYALGAFAGYRFCNGVRLEAELAYRRNAIGKFKFFDSELGANGSMKITTLMANALYEFSINSPLTPYVGLGLGYSRFAHHVTGDQIIDGDFTDDTCAWQAIVGVSYPITYCADLGIEYRYLHPVRFTDDQAIVLSLKNTF